MEVLAAVAAVAPAVTTAVGIEPRSVLQSRARHDPVFIDPGAIVFSVSSWDRSPTAASHQTLGGLAYLSATTASSLGSARRVFARRPTPVAIADPKEDIVASSRPEHIKSSGVYRLSWT